MKTPAKAELGIVVEGVGQAEDESHLRKRQPGMEVSYVNKNALELLTQKLGSKLPSADPMERRTDQMKKYTEVGAKKKLHEENIKNVTKEGKKMLMKSDNDDNSSSDQKTSSNQDFDVLINDTLFQHKIENGTEKVDTVPQNR